MSEKIKKIRFFNVFEYDLEEKFLREMHQKGYAYDNLSKICVYEFNKTELLDMNYKLAYKKIKGEVDKKDFIQMYEDDGWEYIQEVNNFYYFRSSEHKDQSLINAETRDRIFSNSFSDMLIPLIILFAVIYLPTLLVVIGRLGGKPNDFITGFADGVRTAITLIFTAVLFYVFVSYLSEKNSKE